MQKSTNPDRSGQQQLQTTFAFSAFVLIGVNDGAFGVILPGLRNFYHVDNATISLLFLFSAVGYLISAFNSGLLVEKLGERRFLMLGAGIFCLSAILLSLKLPFPFTTCLFLPLGSGIAIFDAGLNSVIASRKENGPVLNYLHAFYGAGAWLGPLIATAYLAWSWGWNNLYLTWGIFSLLLVIAFRLTFARKAASVPDVTTEKKKNIIGETLTRQSVWIAAFFLFFYVGVEVTLGSWGYSFLLSERHEAVLLAGLTISGYWLGLTLGRVILGHFTRSLGSRTMIQLCLLGVISGLLLTWLVPIQAISLAGLLLIGFCLGPIFPTTIALMPEIVPPRLTAGSIGFLTSLASMGAALFPWLAGHTAQWIGIWSLLPYTIVLTVVMSGCWLLLQMQHRESGEDGAHE